MGYYDKQEKEEEQTVHPWKINLISNIPGCGFGQQNGKKHLSFSTFIGDNLFDSQLACHFFSGEL